MINKFSTVLMTIFSLISIQITAQKNYTHLKEYGLNSKVKKVTTYIKNIENNLIPKDTLGHDRKTVMTFDSKGNMLQNARYFMPNKKIDIIKDIITFNYNDNDINYTQKSVFRTQKDILQNLKYVWKDDYNYDIINTDTNSVADQVSLNQNLTLKKEIFKNDGKAIYESEFINEYKDGKLVKRTHKNFDFVDEKQSESFQVEIIKQHDKNGNPSLIYFYDDKNATKLLAVSFKFYDYY